eukprot:1160748-Prorocentrum_minimum.AAC.1
MDAVIAPTPSVSSPKLLLALKRNVSSSCSLARCDSEGMLAVMSPTSPPFNCNIHTIALNIHTITPNIPSMLAVMSPTSPPFNCDSQVTVK